jgi:hypothetical protein
MLDARRVGSFLNCPALCMVFGLDRLGGMRLFYYQPAGPLLPPPNPQLIDWLTTKLLIVDLGDALRMFLAKVADRPVGAFLLIAQGKFNRPNDPVDIIHDLVIPKADDFISQ